MPEAAAEDKINKSDMGDISNALNTLRETVEKNIKSQGEVKEISENFQTYYN